jgi:multicomponent Na+:H+ antiporter subunit E
MALSLRAPQGQRYLVAFAVTWLLWVLLTASSHPQELFAGVCVALLVTLLSAPRLSILDGIKLTPQAPLHLVRYLAYFGRALVQSNLDVARRVLSPALPLSPAVIEVRTQLQSPLGKLVLANSITLTPGTLVVDVQGDRLLVHWIDCPPGTDLAAATQAIAAEFEQHISGFLQ